MPLAAPSGVFGGRSADARPISGTFARPPQTPPPAYQRRLRRSRPIAASLRRTRTRKRHLAPFATARDGSAKASHASDGRVSPPVGACKKCAQIAYFHTPLSYHFFTIIDQPVSPSVQSWLACAPAQVSSLPALRLRLRVLSVPGEYTSLKFRPGRACSGGPSPRARRCSCRPRALPSDPTFRNAPPPSARCARLPTRATATAPPSRADGRREAEWFPASEQRAGSGWVVETTGSHAVELPDYENRRTRPREAHSDDA